MNAELSQQLVIGAVAAGALALLSGLARLLTVSGAIAAFVVGFFIFGFGGLVFTAALLAFFLTSSLLSVVGRRQKAGAAGLFEKGSTRDASQVIANGIVPSIAAIISAVGTRLAPPREMALLALGAIAAVNADTWATEIGCFFSARPLQLRTFRRTSAGTSGAVSAVGLLAALTGAAVIPVAAWLSWPSNSPNLLWRIDLVEVICVAWGGFVAAFADSVIGAGFQMQYRCLACKRLTERTQHCGGPTKYERGLRWINNDVVNLVCSFFGLLFTWFLLTQFGNPR